MTYMLGFTTRLHIMSKQKRRLNYKAALCRFFSQLTYFLTGEVKYISHCLMGKCATAATVENVFSRLKRKQDAPSRLKKSESKTRLSKMHPSLRREEKGGGEGDET